MFISISSLVELAIIGGHLRHRKRKLLGHISGGHYCFAPIDDSFIGGYDKAVPTLLYQLTNSFSTDLGVPKASDYAPPYNLRNYELTQPKDSPTRVAQRGSNVVRPSDDPGNPRSRSSSDVRQAPVPDLVTTKPERVGIAHTPPQPAPGDTEITVGRVLRGRRWGTGVATSCFALCGCQLRVLISAVRNALTWTRGIRAPQLRDKDSSLRRRAVQRTQRRER